MRRRKRHLRWLEYLLIVVAFLSLGYVAYISVEAALYQAYENREREAILASRLPGSATPAGAVQSPNGTSASKTRLSSRRSTKAGVIGRVEIPRLGVSAVVRTGSDARTLRRAVGHIPGTAFPGERGNAGFAGHRDTFFRGLRNIQKDDEIRFKGPDGIHTYRVKRTDIVRPRDTWVLDPTPRPSLTLVTCYPFTYIGSAPQRFIVRAELVASVRGD